MEIKVFFFCWFYSYNLCDIYVKEIRVLVEYAVPVWYSTITREQSNYIEKIQHYAVAMILNDWTLSYEVQCTLLSIEPLYLRHQSIALSFALRTLKNPRHEGFFRKKKNCLFYKE